MRLVDVSIEEFFGMVAFLVAFADACLKWLESEMELEVNFGQLRNHRYETMIFREQLVVLKQF